MAFEVARWDSEKTRIRKALESDETQTSPSRNYNGFAGFQRMPGFHWISLDPGPSELTDLLYYCSQGQSIGVEILPHHCQPGPLVHQLTRTNGPGPLPLVYGSGPPGTACLEWSTTLWYILPPAYGLG